MSAPDDLQATRVRLASVLGALQGIASIPSPTGPDGRPQSLAVRIAQDALARYGVADHEPGAMAQPMNAPARITVTVDRHGEPIVFGARDTPRARANGCSVVEYWRADQAAEAGLAGVLDAMEADAQRQLDAGEAPFVAQADLDAIDRVRGLLGQ
jgi:hypothetical protein